MKMISDGGYGEFYNSQRATDSPSLALEVTFVINGCPNFTKFFPWFLNILAQADFLGIVERKLVVLLPL